MSHFGSKKSIEIGFFEKLALGGLSAGSAATFCHPFDVTKVRLQTRINKSESVFKIWNNMIKNEGIKSFFKGIDAAWSRQLVYSSLRLGIYPIIKNLLQKNENEFLPLYKKIIAGIISGGIGSFIGSPNDLILIRMQSGDFKYKNIFDGLFKTLKNDGIIGLWRGSSPTVIRGMITNATQVAFYDEFKQLAITKFGLKDNKKTHIISSTLAGIATTLISNPIDVSKTKLMNMKPNQNGNLPYNNIFDCLKKVYKTQGLKGLYSGTLPSMSRLVPLTILTMTFYEQFSKLGLKLFHKNQLKQFQQDEEI